MKSILFLLITVALPSLSWADGVRCGSRIFTVGDSSAEMDAVCGHPAQVSRFTVDGVTGSVRAGLRPQDTSGQTAVEIWTFNFGPNQFMQRVRIENGVVVKIESLGYGYNVP
jgi:hypothetical protein